MVQGSFILSGNVLDVTVWANDSMILPSLSDIGRRNGGGTMSNGKAPKTQLENQQLARRKVAKMLIAVVVMFALCFLPVHLINIIRYSRRNKNGVEKFNCNGVVMVLAFSAIALKFQKSILNYAI